MQRVLVDVSALQSLDDVLLEWARAEKVQITFQPDKRQHYRLQDNFEGKKARTLFQWSLEKEGFYASLPARPDAIPAMHAMLASGIDVKIVISVTAGFRKVVAQQMEWVCIRLGGQWEERVVVSLDKTILDADVLIDAQPHPERELVRAMDGRSEQPSAVGQPSPKWRHVLYPQAYNSAVSDKSTLTSWRDWKAALAPSTPKHRTQTSLPHDNLHSADTVPQRRLHSSQYGHGSEDSRDEDRLYLFTEMPPLAEALNFLAGTSEDRNIFTVSKSGYVTACHKGSPDEVHNGLLDTFSLHKQSFALPISAKRMPRVVPLKIYCALEKMHASPSKYREDAGAALKTKDFSVFVRALHAIDLGSCALSGDDHKDIAFQILQSLALVKGVEVYTKRTAADFLPPLRPFLYRDPNANIDALSTSLKTMLRVCESVRAVKRGDLQAFCVDKNCKEWNHLTAQSRGLVIDHERRTLVLWGASYEADLRATWPLDPPLPPVSGHVTYVCKSASDALLVCTERGFDVRPQAQAQIEKHAAEHGVDTHFLTMSWDGAAGALIARRDRQSLLLEAMSVDEEAEGDDGGDED